MIVESILEYPPSHLRRLLSLAVAIALGASGCSSGDGRSPNALDLSRGPRDAMAEGPACEAAAHAAPGDADVHCMTDTGRPIRQHVAGCRPAGADPSAEGEIALRPRLTDSMVLFNGEGSDDDCKYETRLSIVPACEPAPTLELALARSVDQTPVLGAAARAELFFADNTSPVSLPAAAELADGLYRFAAPVLEHGRWMARIHLFEACAYDDESSPRGQVAFAIDVPRGAVDVGR